MLGIHHVRGVASGGFATVDTDETRMKMLAGDATCSRGGEGEP